VAAAALEFRLLGELEVLVGGRPVALGGAKQRALLALLLIERGRAVSADRLIEAIWSARAPESARKSVQVYVSGLRKTLGDGRIITRGRGYELAVGPGEVDADVFDRLVREAASAPPDVAAKRLRKALALVRGRPLADVALEPWAAPEVDRLEERILAAKESRIAADLELGRHAEVVPELEDLVERQPYREHLLELLMLALYRSGRQADALEVYRREAARIRRELALQLSRPLQQLEASILQQDPALDGPPAPREPRRFRARRRSWKLIAAGAATVIAAAAAAAGVAFTRGGRASLASLPAGVAIIATNDGSLVAHISTAEIPEPVEAVTGNGHFWVWGLHPFQLVEIDPQNGRILRHVGSPFAGDATWYLPDGRDVWFTRSLELVRVDAEEGRAVDRYILTRTPTENGLAGVSRCFGSLWVADNPDNLVLRIDPASGRVQARIPTQYPYAIACGDGGLWVSWYDKGLHRIDPRTNRIVATASTPAPYVNEVAVGGGFAWTPNEAQGTVYKVDREGKVVAVYETGDGAHLMSFGGARLWVANQDAGTVTGIDAATGARTSYTFRHPVQSVAAQGSRLLVELSEGLTFEDRIAVLRGKVAKLIVPAYVFDPVDPALAWSPWAFMAERATCAGLVSQQPGTRGRLVPDLAAAMPRVSRDGRTYTFTVLRGRRFAPPSGAPVTAEDVRASIERALSRELGISVPGVAQPGVVFLGDVDGAKAFHSGRARHVRGIKVDGDTISFTLARPSKTFLKRLALPFFCTVPADTPTVHGGLTKPAPSAGPYYMSDAANGEYEILKRNSNYTGSWPAKLDAIAFREGISPEHAVARVRSGAWDGALLQDNLLAPGGGVAREASLDARLRTEELPAASMGIAFARARGRVLHALLSSRLGCDNVRGAIDVASLCLRER
jgi:DNA-binding SARP family transcriptional activator/antitoxin (DNA-binding transcriptional repressor) of toxin-antitoxin stability system